MQKITFTQTHNVFLDNGIVALYRYLQRASRDELPSWMAPLQSFGLREGVHFTLSSTELNITHDRLFDLLEEVYYVMGKEVYDTSTNKQDAEADKFYFIEEPFQALPFAKMKTYGFAALLTNDIPPISGKGGQKIKFDKLLKDNQTFATRIAFDLKQKGRKLKFHSVTTEGEVLPNSIANGKHTANNGGESEIFINAGYTKTPELPLHADYLKAGSEYCSLTGDAYKKLVNVTNTSPFFKGLKYQSFNSNFTADSNVKISWKSMYLSRFSPAACLYQYARRTKDDIWLNVYFVYSDSLIDLKNLLQDKLFGGLMRDFTSLKHHDFMANFPRNEENNPLGRSGEYIGRYESLFYIIHSLYHNILGGKPAPETYQLLIEYGLHKNVGIVSIRAEDYSQTVRPKYLEYLSHFRYTMDIINRLEKQGINFRSVLSSLKIIKPSLKSGQNGYAVERQLRERILSRVLNGKTILNDIEGYYVDCYGYLLDTLNDSAKNIGFKHYNKVFDFLNAYETTTNQVIMDNVELQRRAINLGKQVGGGILNYNPSSKEQLTKKDRETNARQGRKHIIRLQKGNRFDKFLEAVIEVQKRFGFYVSGDLLETITEDNYSWVKQFVIISALNQINSELNPRQSTTNENK